MCVCVCVCVYNIGESAAGRRLRVALTPASLSAGRRTGLRTPSSRRSTTESWRTRAAAHAWKRCA